MEHSHSTYIRVRISREAQDSQHSQHSIAKSQRARKATNRRSTSCQTVFVLSMTESAGPQLARRADGSNRATSAGSVEIEALLYKDMLVTRYSTSLLRISPSQLSTGRICLFLLVPNCGYQLHLSATLLYLPREKRKNPLVRSFHDTTLLTV